jgi:hypothetical protein
MKHLIALILSLLIITSTLAGCTENSPGESTSVEEIIDQKNTLYPNDVDPNEGVSACADISPSSSEQPCPSGLNMRKLTSANGYEDWTAFTEGALDKNTPQEFDLKLDANEFRFSRWTLSVSSKELTNPHVYLDWVDSNGKITPIGGSVMGQSTGVDKKTLETKDERWLDVKNEFGEKVRTLQMLISIEEGTTLRVKVVDGAGDAGDYKLSLTIYTNRAPIGEVQMLSPSKVGKNATMYLNGCNTYDPDFISRENDNSFGKLTWMLDSTNESQVGLRLDSWGTSACFIKVELKDRNLELGMHQIHLLVRDQATALNEEPDDVVTIEFEVISDNESYLPERIGQTIIDVGVKETLNIDAVSPMQFIDLPFTRSDFSIGIGIRFELGISRTGDVSFDHIVDPTNGTFDLLNASSQISSDIDFRPWILVKYSIWDKSSRQWTDGEVQIPMLSCAYEYEGMPKLLSNLNLTGCDNLYYWDKALPVTDVYESNNGKFEIDRNFNVAALDLQVILNAVVSPSVPITALISLLDKVGTLEIPLSFGMNVRGNGVLTVGTQIISNGLTIDGQNQIDVELLGIDEVTSSSHTLSDGDGFLAISPSPRTDFDVTLTPTIGIGITYSIFGIYVFDYNYKWELSQGTGINSKSTLTEGNIQAFLWEI